MCALAIPVCYTRPDQVHAWDSGRIEDDKARPASRWDGLG